MRIKRWGGAPPIPVGTKLENWPKPAFDRAPAEHACTDRMVHK
jgi:hypothetical protein